MPRSGTSAPPIVSEEGSSCVWGGVLPGSLVGRARGFLLLPFAACIVSEEGSHVRGGYPFDYYLFDYYPFDGYPIKPNHPNHNHSIFCLLSLTPDATNTMRFCSGFIFSIRTRRHLVLTQPPKPTHPPRDVVHVEEERGHAVVAQRHADDRGVVLGHSG